MKFKYLTALFMLTLFSASTVSTYAFSSLNSEELNIVKKKKKQASKPKPKPKEENEGFNPYGSPFGGYSGLE